VAYTDAVHDLVADLGASGDGRAQVITWRWSWERESSLM
jgi:hypothetical protein